MNNSNAQQQHTSNQYYFDDNNDTFAHHFFLPENKQQQQQQQQQQQHTSKNTEDNRIHHVDVTDDGGDRVYLQPFSKNYLFTKSIREDYDNYTKYILWLKIHGMVTAFLMLWSLASGTLPHEIMATKFLHVMAPFLVLHWWHLSNYPIHLFLLLYLEEHQRETMKEIPYHGKIKVSLKEDDESNNFRGFFNKTKLRIHKGTLSGMLMYFVLFVCDLLYFCIRIAPLTDKCLHKDDVISDGTSAPIECTGVVLQNSHNTSQQPKTLFLISLITIILHIVLDVVVIWITYTTRSKYCNKKTLN